jgi:hypothetical protein
MKKSWGKLSPAFLYVRTTFKISGSTGPFVTQDMHRSHSVSQAKSISSINTQPGSATDARKSTERPKAAFTLSRKV